MSKKPESKSDQKASDFPAGLAQPALRALASAGCATLAQVARLSETEVKNLHGIGPNALKKLRQALAAKGLRFRAE